MSGSQRGLVQNTLAKFDANNLSAADIKFIQKTFRFEGIRPSAELKAEIKAAGFDLEAMRSATGPRGVGNPPPPPPKQEDEDKEMLSTFLELLEEYQDQKDKWLEIGNSVGDSFVSIIA
jgi:hypothetical protein